MNPFPDLLELLKNTIQPGRKTRKQLEERVRELEDQLKEQVPPSGYDYDADCLRVWLRNLSFPSDPRFIKAYALGMDSGHQICRAPGSRTDIHIKWRVHMLLWAATHAAHLEGDFVECGVNTGIYSLAVCDYLDFNKTGKSFYLFDTFEGVPVEQMNEHEKLSKSQLNTVWYPECFDRARANFQPYTSAVLVRGMVPDTLTQVDIQKVAYLSIDMNIVAPEIAAITFFWDKLVTGAVVVLDDYGFKGYEDQKAAMDDFARSKGVEIASLPTGQGLLLKP